MKTTAEKDDKQAKQDTLEFIFRKDNENVFLERWQEYVSTHLASYRYLPVCLDYLLYYIQNLYSDESCVAVQNNQAVAVCFLPVEEFDGRRSITSAGGYLAAPLAVNKRIEKKVYEKINDIAQEQQVKAVRFYLDPLVAEYHNKFNSLLEYGFIDTTSSDGILDLRQTQEELWASLRKGHKSDVKKVLNDKDFEIVTVDHLNPAYDIHEDYRFLHKKCAGRETRVKETFEKQFQMLKDDNAVLFGLKFKEKFIGFSYFFHFSKTVAYASGADDPDFNDIPLYHALVWTAVMYYHEKRSEYMHLARPCGYNTVNGFGDYLDEKQVNISRFKRGFGVSMIPFFRGVKYFDQALLLEDIEKFKNKAKEVLSC